MRNVPAGRREPTLAGPANRPQRGPAPLPAPAPCACAVPFVSRAGGRRGAGRAAVSAAPPPSAPGRGGGGGIAGSAMVKKRKGRVLIDSDTEDSGSEENLDQVRGEAWPGRGAWDLRPAPGLGAAIPPSFPRSRPGVARRRRSPQPDGGPRGLRGESPLPSGGSLACPWRAARPGGFRGLLAAGPVLAGGRRSAGRRGDAPAWLGPEEGRAGPGCRRPSPLGQRGKRPKGLGNFSVLLSHAGRAACQLPASRRPRQPLGAGGLQGAC